MLVFVTKLFQIVLSYCAAIIIYPAFLTMLLLFYIFKKLVECYLKLKYGKQFGNMIGSSDSMWIEGEPQKNLTDAILIVNMDLNNSIDIAQETKSIIKKSIIENAENVPKMTSIMQTCCGFGYLLRIDVDIDKCITMLTVKEDSRYYAKTLEDIMEEYSNNKLPYDNKLLWQIIFVTGSVEWKARQNIKEHQIFLWLRLHHVAADGVSAVKNFTGMYSDGTEDVSENFQKILRKFKKKQNFIEKCLDNFHVCMLLPSFLISTRFKKSLHVNHFKSSTEKGNNRYFPIIDYDDTILHSIKRIKNTLGDTAFAEVVLTSISASLERYFANNCDSVPDMMSVTIPVIMNINDTKKKNGIKLKNSFGLVLVNLPISVKSTSLTERLAAVKKCTRQLVHSYDTKIRFFLINYVLGLIPSYFIKYLAEDLGMCFSNFPGIPKVRASNGLELEHLLFYPPIRGPIGLATALMTYNNKIHFTLVIDDKVMTNKKDCQRIVADVFQYIRLFDEEVWKETSPTQIISEKL